MLNNINFEKLQKDLKLTKKGIKSTAISALIGVAMGAFVLGCGGKNNNDAAKSSNNTTIETQAETKEATQIENETEVPTEEAKITELNVELFNKLVDEVEAANKNVNFNLRRENLELAVYINNINIATPELVQKIESSYNYNEEDMINVYLQTMTSYNNDKNDYYKGEDTVCADKSLLFVDSIDKETVKYIDGLFEELHKNVSSESNIELTMEKFNKMVEDIMSKNKEIGLEFDKQDIEISIYQRNAKYATEEVKKYISSLKLAENDTLEIVDTRVLGNYKYYNKTAETKFNLSNLEYESYYIANVVDELEGYMRENDTINGYTKDQLTIGGMFTTKLQVDDAFAYFATTGYANEYEANIGAIAEANLEACVARTYAVLGSKAALVNCETQTLTK